jgi:hypothetical protein
MLYAPYFYDALMNGLGDETLNDGSELFELTTEDWTLFPELENSKFAVLSESDSGFVHVDITDDDPRDDQDDSNLEFSEPEEGDITTEDHSSFYQYGKLWLFVHPDSWTTNQELNEQIRERMSEEKFWPNVWFISDHGNAHLLSLED